MKGHPKVLNDKVTGLIVIGNPSSTAPDGPLFAPCRCMWIVSNCGFELVAKLAGSLNQSKADAERTFDTITNTILDALKNDDSVKIAGFGTYKVAKRKARIGRNPRTGEQIQIAASQKVKFLPAKALKEIFNK